MDQIPMNGGERERKKAHEKSARTKAYTVVNRISLYFSGDETE